ncbi:Uncharacterised protein [Pandoraea pulmonicola]|uniref:Uncharacterized protein n=1 Tax=Pandoraea pulmonicola TaxID=93221 RepID=A0AAJ4ZE30_PANPU|nr:Uncharacterised protein [Pandoraea pulmonicola]
MMPAFGDVRQAVRGPVQCSRGGMPESALLG